MNLPAARKNYALALPIIGFVLTFLKYIVGGLRDDLDKEHTSYLKITDTDMLGKKRVRYYRHGHPFLDSIGVIIATIILIYSFGDNVLSYVSSSVFLPFIIFLTVCPLFIISKGEVLNSVMEKKGYDINDKSWSWHFKLLVALTILIPFVSFWMAMPGYQSETARVFRYLTSSSYNDMFMNIFKYTGILWGVMFAILMPLSVNLTLIYSYISGKGVKGLFQILGLLIIILVGCIAVLYLEKIDLIEKLPNILQQHEFSTSIAVLYSLLVGIPFIILYSGLNILFGKKSDTSWLGRLGGLFLSLISFAIIGFPNYYAWGVSSGEFKFRISFDNFLSNYNFFVSNSEVSFNVIVLIALLLATLAILVLAIRTNKSNLTGKSIASIIPIGLIILTSIMFKPLGEEYNKVVKENSYQLEGFKSLYQQ